MVEEEEERVGISRQTYLGRAPIGKQGKGHALVRPAQNLGEGAEPRRRPLPSVGDDIGDAHRGRPVLQDDEVDT